MDERDWLAERFEEHRGRLRAVAYRMLGSLSEADDAVQEAWLRLNRSDSSEVEALGAWLTTVVGRVSLNMLRSRKSGREDPLAPRVPEPIVDRADGQRGDTDATAYAGSAPFASGARKNSEPEAGLTADVHTAAGVSRTSPAINPKSGCTNRLVGCAQRA